MLTALPVLFVSHGAPTFAVEPGLAGPQLTRLGRALPPVDAVLVISPHWMTQGEVRVAASAQPDTIHDFGGFPPALYALRYPAPGHPALAARAAALLGAAGYHARLDERRGLDHGAWVPMMHLYPEARVPVFQVSLPQPLDPAGALALGRALAPLREQGVLIMGSGSMTHNLYEFRGHGSDAPYVAEFTGWVREAVRTVMRNGDIQQLIDYRRLAPHAARAHPSDEHFLPLLAAIGAAKAGEPLQVIDGGITYGVLSMESYAIGQSRPAQRTPEIL
ncbi:class III extradiol ring-cleavage dioxygenase [Cupriavidus basilensis]|uniref:Class III extradiol ring-cleavage dioxygenase n=1 Tax=Cupriavidus basilensis TaxID=68895 RepID=A0ABT6AWB9_9BURK|nr:class III extradiol ring-cleavage dioxygenase [Cupriavidus basilensis]MDF3836532.1 class III extradiol ring-cleavage dioxygenase [Cupriavidus basilensis]